MLTLEGFRKWLESRSGGDIVGWRGDPCDCPIANYLKSGGSPDARVGDNSYRLHEFGESTPLSRAFQTFISEVDDYDPGEDPALVTASEALLILRGIA